MTRVFSNELISFVDKEVRVSGWLSNFRALGKIAFLILRDGKGFIQIVVENKRDILTLKKLQVGSIIHVEGSVRKTEQSDIGIEIINPKITVEKKVLDVPPIEINKSQINAGIDVILDYRPLSLRNEKLRSVFKIQALILEAYRSFLIANGFTEFFGPAIIGASSEGGAELFNVDYFGFEAKLAQSNQLYKQMMVGVFERVFGSLKCFRAEKSHTRRHLTEATQLEFEIGFIDGLDDVLKWQEKVIRAIYEHVAHNAEEEINKFFPDFASLSSKPIARFSLKETLDLYYQETGVDDRKETDLSPEAERFISAYAKKQTGSDFVFVTHYPKTKCAFYAKPSQDNPEVCEYADLICNGTEVSSGGQRISDYEELKISLKSKGLNPKDFEDYLLIFKYGMPEHGGFGLGLERFTMQLLGLDNVREATLFPSDTKRIASVKFKKQVFGEDNLVNEIKKTLEFNDIDYNYVEHEEVVTSEQASDVRGTRLEQGVKAIILKGKKSGKNIMVALPANKKVNMKAVKDYFGENFEMETPENIEKLFGLKIGGIPPFGTLLGLDLLIDESILDEEIIDFNCGKRTCSIEMKSEDLFKVLDAIRGNWSKNG
jgi:nondiscriminating aspartyl-tRNA synthetase